MAKNVLPPLLTPREYVPQQRRDTRLYAARSRELFIIIECYNRSY